jgi:hypothetical protein
MAPESIDRLGKITTEPAPQEAGPEAERTKAAEKDVAMGKGDVSGSGGGKYPRRSARKRCFPSIHVTS